MKLTRGVRSTLLVELHFYFVASRKKLTHLALLIRKVDTLFNLVIKKVALNIRRKACGIRRKSRTLCRTVGAEALPVRFRGKGVLRYCSCIRNPQFLTPGMIATDAHACYMVTSRGASYNKAWGCCLLSGVRYGDTVIQVTKA